MESRGPHQVLLEHQIRFIVLSFPVLPFSFLFFWGSQFTRKDCEAWCRLRWYWLRGRMFGLVGLHFQGISGFCHRTSGDFHSNSHPKGNHHLNSCIALPSNQCISRLTLFAFCTFALWVVFHFTLQPATGGGLSLAQNKQSFWVPCWFSADFMVGARIHPTWVGFLLLSL